MAANHTFMNKSPEQIYDECLEDYLNAVFDGYNASFIVVGKFTSPGHTTKEPWEVEPLQYTLQAMVCWVLDTPNMSYQMWLSCVTVQNGRMADVINPSSELHIKEDRKWGIQVCGAEEMVITEEGMEYV